MGVVVTIVLVLVIVIGICVGSNQTNTDDKNVKENETNLDSKNIKKKESKKERLKKEREAELAKLNDIEYTKVVTTSTTSSGNMYGHHSVAKTTFLIVYKDGSKGVVEVPHNSEFYLEYAMRVKTDDEKK